MAGESPKAAGSVQRSKQVCMPTRDRAGDEGAASCAIQELARERASEEEEEVARPASQCGKGPGRRDESSG
jgi:hypothetical protein